MKVSPNNNFLFFVVILTSFILMDKICLSQEIKRFGFDKEDALSEWKEKIFHKRVLYTIEDDGESKFLVAKSDRASSGLFYPIRFSPKKYPYISWRWKVRSFPSKNQVISDITKKSWIERDDYAVRLYVIFPAFIFTNTKCIEYIWAEHLPKGAILTSPFFRNIKLIVLESGNEKADEWVTEERNILNDYKAAFNKTLSSDIGAIALMTDSDNTQSSAEGCYANIRVGYQYALKNEEDKPKINYINGFVEYIKDLAKRIFNR